jgi:8-oxo-dGTP diphosphatase
MEDSSFDIDEKIFGVKLKNIEWRSRKAVYGIAINNENEIAVIKTPTGFFLPGGGMEGTERYVECLKREFLEETGHEIEVGDFIGRASLYHTTRTNEYIHGIGYFYTVSLKCKRNHKTEHDHELRWLEADECIKSLFLEHQSWAVSKVLGLV